MARSTAVRSTMGASLVFGEAKQGGKQMHHIDSISPYAIRNLTNQ